MGSGRDKRKKNKGSKTGIGAIKTAKKTEKNLAKSERREARKAQDEDNDIDSLLAKFKLQDEESNRVVIEEKCDAPSPRVYASCLAQVCLSYHIEQLYIAWWYCCCFVP
jgi:hypothetical protein